MVRALGEKEMTKKLPNQKKTGGPLRQGGGGAEAPERTRGKHESLPAWSQMVMGGCKAITAKQSR